MRTKNIIYIITLLFIAITLYVLYIKITEIDDSSTHDNSTETKTKTKPEQPLNISIFLDLSDRLTRDLTPSQMSRDTAIINNIIDYFKTETLGPKILKSRNNIKVFFYPAPSHPQIATLADDLNVDIALQKGKDKRIALEKMKDTFQASLTQIYSKTIMAQNWIGCDIWGFFSNKKVDTQCIRKDCRNIIFILTDGYLFDANNKIQNGNAYSYILPQTLNVANSSLIVKRNGLENLEVCVLEVNPYNPKDHDKIVSTLEKWFLAMGVKKESLCIAETDLPTNTKTIIKSFLEK